MTSSVHISLNVRDLARSVDFYRKFFGEPARLEPDYAKFVAREPEIHLALEPRSAAADDKPGTRQEHDHAGALSHLGIRVSSSGEVARRRADLLGRGLTIGGTKREVCCYAPQEKFWVNDPDDNRWEIYTVLEEAGETGPFGCEDCCPR